MGRGTAPGGTIRLSPESRGGPDESGGRGEAPMTVTVGRLNAGRGGGSAPVGVLAALPGFDRVEPTPRLAANPDSPETVGEGADMKVGVAAPAVAPYDLPRSVTTDYTQSGRSRTGGGAEDCDGAGSGADRRGVSGAPERTALSSAAGLRSLAAAPPDPPDRAGSVTAGVAGGGAGKAGVRIGTAGVTGSLRRMRSTHTGQCHSSGGGSTKTGVRQ
jgi:hypothetical protein